MIARPYQLELVDAVWGEMFKESTALAQLPTGGGKTFCFSLLIKRALEVPGCRVGVLMGRIDLVSQTEKAIAKVVDRRHLGIYCGSLNRKETTRPVTVASIQSIRGLRGLFFHMLIVDEAHNINQTKGGYSQFIEECRSINPKIKIIGWTATPFRTKGYIYGPEKLFKHLCYQKTISEMIALGFSCRPILKQGENAFDTSSLRMKGEDYLQEDVDRLVSNEDTLTLQVNEALSKMDGRKAVAWATANIEHCNRVLDALQAKGEYATSVHSKQNRDTRDANLSSFTGGGARHMVFVSILSEGFDYPPIDCIVLMRPTRSPVLYVQTVGRGLRIWEGKPDCLVLDYGQVVRELGPLDDPLVKDPAKKKRGGGGGVKLCDSCQTWVPSATRICPECDFEFPFEAPEEKLSRAADTDAEILSKKSAPTTESLGPCEIAMHESKNGNQCVRITYRDGNILNRWGGYPGTSEYFVISSPWAMERLERRLNEIDAELPGIPFEEPILIRGTFEVVKTKDGKYDRILSVKKILDKSPADNVVDLFNRGTIT